MSSVTCCCCDAPDSEAELYECDVDGCKMANKFYCIQCGTAVHRRLNHTFKESLANNCAHDNDDNDENDKKISTMEKERNISSKHRNSVTLPKKVTPMQYGLGLGIGTATLAGTMKEFGGLAATASLVGGVAAGTMFAVSAASWYLAKQEIKSKPPDLKTETESIALAMFQFDANDLGNEERFNPAIIKKRYNRLARYYHPDRAHGDEATFIRLDIARNLLLFMFDGDEYPLPINDLHKLCCVDETVCSGTKKAIGYQHRWRSNHKYPR